MIKTLAVTLVLVMGMPGMALGELARHQAGEKSGAMMPSIEDNRHRRKPFKFEGALDIRIHPHGDQLEPPAELLLIDPEGRKVGRDPATDTTFSEIPGASYGHEGIDDAVTGAPGPQTAIIDVRNPATGKYVLQVIGKESAKYDLAIRGYDCEMDPSDAEFLNVMIHKDSEHTYSIEYSNDIGSQIEVVQTRDPND
ncbi:MAG: hypothetical protein JRI70_09470 [Deltaproteobacteria bacterium]|nr:hypothetical protein [Deltaproteobacteria bacterium]